MFDSLNLGFNLPADFDAQKWIATAPAWFDCTGVLNAKGYLTCKFGPETGKMCVGYNPTTRRGYLRGSLHTYHHGHNSGPFPYADVLQAHESLLAALLLPPTLLLVRTVETGLTVAIPSVPAEVIANLRYARYAGKPFEPMPTPKGQPRPLGFYVPFTEYRIKAYDKGADSMLKNRPLPIGRHGFRYEKCYDKSRKLAADLGLSCPISLDCLIQPVIYTKLCKLIWHSWLMIEFIPTLEDFARYGIILSSKEADLISAYANNPNHSKQKVKLGITSEKTCERESAILKDLRQRFQAVAPAHPYTGLIKRDIVASLP